MDDSEPLPHRTPGETRSTVASQVVKYLVWTAFLAAIVLAMAYADDIRTIFTRP